MTRRPFSDSGPIEDVIVAEYGGQRAPSTAPLMVHDWPELLAQCRVALSRRQEAYPALIAAGRMTADQAGRDIAGWEALLAEWTWIVTAEGAPPPSHTLKSRIDAVELAQLRVKQEMDRGNRGHEICRQSHLLQALRWHLATAGADNEPRIHFHTRINHARRAELGQNFCGTCERWKADPEVRACTATSCGLGAYRLPTIENRSAA
jgi:hypothetical protein